MIKAAPIAGGKSRQGRLFPFNLAPLALVALGLLMCDTVQAQIVLHDGSTNLVANSGTTNISVNMTVTPGANVLVVSLFDRNNNSGLASPASLTWNPVTPQTLTRVVAVNNAASAWADSDIYYLWNPSPGTATITATDRSGNIPTALTMQVYALAGVDTNVAPVTSSTNNSSVTSLTVALSGSTPAGSWAVVNSSYGTGNNTTYVTSSSGAVNCPEVWNITSQALGYVGNLSAGSSSISVNSGSVSAQKMALGIAIFAPRGTTAPTNVVATSLANHIALSWTDASGGAATGYIVLRSTTRGSGYTAIATNAGNASVTYTDTNVVSSVVYYYVVQATGPGGTGPYSAEVSGFVGPPPAPTGLTTAVGNGAVVLNWNALPSATAYNVLRATTNPASQGSYTAITNTAAPSYTDIGLINGTTYYYEVNAVNSSGTGAPSAYVSAIPGVIAGPPLAEIRTASPTILVALFKDPNWSGPVWGRTYSTNAVAITNLSLWRLNGAPVSAIDEFVTEANAVDYHIYLHVPPLVNRTAYTLATPYGSTNFVFDDSKIFCESIKVNQNGYSALSQVRYANLATWLGTGGAQPISGTLPNYVVFNQFTGQTVTQGAIAPLFGGGQDPSSGDYVYRIDLSAVPPGGPYRISVSGYGCSNPFGIGGDFSRRLAHVAFRGLYYERCGCPIVQPYAWANVRPYGCHTNIYDNQSPDSPSTSSINTSTNSTPLYVHGGYHDAGDTQKNPYALAVPIVLMTTYELFPNVFTDQQFNIPDLFDAEFNIVGSGNGVPDILDEAMWGLMLYTNLQSTAKEPVGAIAFGTASNDEPAWGLNFDQDPLIYSTETNNYFSTGMAAGAFMHMARLIRPYNAQLSTNLQMRADSAYNFAIGRGMTYQHQLYYAIQKYLLTGDVAASNNIRSLYTRISNFPNSYNDEAGGFVSDNGNIWMASYFMSYIVASNRPTDSAIVTYFKQQLQSAADKEVGYLNNDAYPVGWPTNANPQTQYNYVSGFFTSQGQFAYPCLMQWALTGTQKYIDAVSQLMDYDQGLNPIGKCYLTGVGFERVHNPHQIESSYAEDTLHWGGPQPGITVYGPGCTQTRWYGSPQTSAPQIPNANTLPRERIYVDDLGNVEWNEFTDFQCLCWPAAIYPVLAQGGTWNPRHEPFLNPAASINVLTNGVALTFGGLPGQAAYVQVSPTIMGPWTDLSGPLLPDASGTVRYTDIISPTPAARYYRARWAGPIY